MKPRIKPRIKPHIKPQAGKGSRRAPARSAKPSTTHGPGWWALAIFLLALVLRLFFWQATVDAEWPGSVYYKGDAWVWLDYASALERGQLFELGVPIRPPGMAYLVDSQWNSGLADLWKVILRWTVLGALAAMLFFLAARRAFGLRAGLIVGLLCAGSTGLMVLSTSLNNETPYLVLLAGIFWLSEAVSRSARAPVLVTWGALNGVACLFRAEHALFFVLAFTWLVLRRTAGVEGRVSRPKLAVAILIGFGLSLAPWHLKIWSQIAELNHGPDRSAAATVRLQDAHEKALSYLEWRPEAEKARADLPAFLRRPAANFVAATVAHRGRSSVTEADFGILDEAFGYVPEPLAAFPFVVSTGGLNFLLANHTASDGGFKPGPLATPPPLAGGPGAFPASFIGGLPPSQLAFSYPGHLRLVNQGYRLGWNWVRRNPADALGLAVKKLAIFWRGATMGITGWNVPLGQGGLRRAVDLVTPEGSWPAVWRWLMLPLVGWGAVLAWSRPAARVWLIFLASKVAVAVLFYGYARQGATAIPVIALVLALLVCQWTEHAEGRQRRLLQAAVVVAALLIGAEAIRYLQQPELVVDGRKIRAGDVLPPDDHLQHTVAFQ